MEKMVTYKDFYKGKRVLVTGHTGFKGAWLCEILISFGAKVTGYSLQPKSEPNLFSLLNLEGNMNSVIGDIRNLTHLQKIFEEYQPEIVFHLAAQAIVLDSYENPAHTYETNVMGTVNVLECIRNTHSVMSVVNVTTDKVYKNNEWEWGYRENDQLCGFDPYSNSKSCSELVTQSYKLSFFQERNISVSTARAGNVIGGGDFSPNRIIPDSVRAMIEKQAIKVRNPNSIRPYQHVLEPLFSYLQIAKEQYKDRDYAGCYNIGPDDCDCITTGELASIFCMKWQEGAKWESTINNGPHEANFLKLDCSRMKKVFDWKPTWHVEEAIEKTIDWSKVFMRNKNIKAITDEQIREFIVKNMEKIYG